MLEQYQSELIVGGLVVIAGLLWLIGWQLRSQRQVREAQQALLEEMRIKAQEQRDYLVESVRVISSAMGDGQCELTEGCIRLKKLLDHLAPYLHEHQDYAIINQMYELTKHMPILDEWKKLKLKQRFAMTQQREALETEHRDAVEQAAKSLSRYNFEQ